MHCYFPLNVKHGASQLYLGGGLQLSSAGTDSKRNTTHRGLFHVGAISNSRLIPEDFNGTGVNRRLLQCWSHNTWPAHRQRLRQTTYQLVYCCNCL